MRKGIYFKLKNFDRPAEEQRTVFYIAHFPRGSGLTGFAGRPFAGGRPGAEEMWIKAITQGFSVCFPWASCWESLRASLVRPARSERTIASELKPPSGPLGLSDLKDLVKFLGLHVGQWQGTPADGKSRVNTQRTVSCYVVDTSYIREWLALASVLTGRALDWWDSVFFLFNASVLSSFSALAGGGVTLWNTLQSSPLIHLQCLEQGRNLLCSLTVFLLSHPTPLISYN